MSKKLIFTSLLAFILGTTAILTPVYADGNTTELANDTSTVDPSSDGSSTNTITRPSDDGVSEICDESHPECQKPASDSEPDTTPTEAPAITPEGELVTPEGEITTPDTSTADTTSDDLLARLDFAHNWPMYLSFGSIILAILFFIILNIVDRKRRKA